MPSNATQTFSLDHLLNHPFAIYGRNFGEARSKVTAEASEQSARRDLSELGGASRMAYRFHMAYCWFCKKYDRQLRLIGEAFRKCSEKKMATTDTDALKKKIIGRLQS